MYFRDTGGCLSEQFKYFIQVFSKRIVAVGLARRTWSVHNPETSQMLEHREMSPVGGLVR